MHQIHFLLGLCPRDPAGGAHSAPRPLPLFKGPTSKEMEGNGRGEEKVKGKEGERWMEAFGPPKNFGVAPPTPKHNRSRPKSTTEEHVLSKHD